VLQRLHDEVPTDHFTLGWLMHSLHKRSFGIIMLLLALVAMAHPPATRKDQTRHHQAATIATPLEGRLNSNPKRARASVPTLLRLSRSI